MIAPYLDFFATGAHVGQDGIDADLVDYTQTSVGQTQGDPAVFRFNKNTTVLQVRQETTFGFVVCVGNIVADHRLLPSNLANTCHGALLKDIPNWKNESISKISRFINDLRKTIVSRCCELI